MHEIKISFFVLIIVLFDLCLIQLLTLFNELIKTIILLYNDW